MLNNKTYNGHNLDRIKLEYGSPNGCEIEVIGVQKISEHGRTSKRFDK